MHRGLCSRFGHDRDGWNMGVCGAALAGRGQVRPGAWRGRARATVAGPGRRPVPRTLAHTRPRLCSRATGGGQRVRSSIRSEPRGRRGGTRRLAVCVLAQCAARRDLRSRPGGGDQASRAPVARGGFSDRLDQRPAARGRPRPACHSALPRRPRASSNQRFVRAGHHRGGSRPGRLRLAPRARARAFDPARPAAQPNIHRRGARERARRSSLDRRPRRRAAAG